MKNGVEEKGTFAVGFGGTHGFSSAIGRFFEDRLLVVLLSNENPAALGATANDVWNTLLGFEVDPIE